MIQILCINCGANQKYLIKGVCKACYQRQYSKFFYKDRINSNLEIKHIQRNIITSQQKVCSVCGNIFFTQGRINHGKTCSLNCRKKHYQLYFNTPEKKQQRHLYHLTHLKERQIREQKYLISNPTYKIAKTLRSNLRINLNLKFGDKKDSSFAKIVGYSYGDAKKHLEKQFEPHMNWNNYGKVWQVDHIVPLNYFKTKEQFTKRGWALKNLQPLEKELNVAKQDLYVGNPKTKIKVIKL